MSDGISCQVGCGTGDASLYSIREGQVGYASDLCFHQLRMTGGAQLRFQEFRTRADGPTAIFCMVSGPDAPAKLVGLRRPCPLDQH